jgi:hypothetical protein
LLLRCSAPIHPPTMHACMHARTHIYACMHAYTYINNAYVHINACIYPNIHTRAHTHTCTHKDMLACAAQSTCIGFSLTERRGRVGLYSWGTSSNLAWRPGFFRGLSHFKQMPVQNFKFGHGHIVSFND